MACLSEKSVIEAISSTLFTESWECKEKLIRKKERIGKINFSVIFIVHNFCLIIKIKKIILEFQRINTRRNKLFNYS